MRRSVCCGRSWAGDPVSLQVGELAAILSLDDTPLKSGSDAALARFAADVDRSATEAGDEAGRKLADGIEDGVSQTDIPADDLLPDSGSLDLAGLAAGTALGAALFAGISETLSQEAGSDRLAAQLGMTPAESEEAGRIAGSLYAGAYGESMGQVNDSVGAVLSTLGRLGLEGEANVERVSAKALDLAATFDLDVARSVSSAGILMTTGLARDADHAFDLITRGMQEMPAHLREELLEASDEYSSFFASLGISGEEAFGMLVDASADGMYGIDKTGDALKELTIRATDMSTASVGAYEKAGLGAEEMSARFLAGGDTARGALDDLVEGLLGIEDPVERANTAVALFGTPIEDLNVSAIPEFLGGLASMESSLGDVEGAAAAMGDTLNDNAATRLEGFKRGAMTGFVNFLGGTLVPAVDSVGTVVLPVVDAFMALPQPIQLAIAAGAGLKMTWGPLVSTAASLSSRLKDVSSSTVMTASAATAAYAAWMLYTAGMEDAKASADAFSRGTEAEHFRAIAEGGATAEEAYASVSRKVNDLGEALNGTTNKFEQVSYQTAIDELMETRDAIGGVVTQSEALAEEYGVSAAAAEVWLGQQAALGKVFADDESALAAYGDVVEENNGLTHEAAAATQDATEALQEHQDMLRAIADPLFAMNQAIISNSEAQFDLEKLEKNGAATAAELAEARIRVAETAFDAEAAATELAAAVDAGTVSTGGARDMLDRWVSSGLISAETAKQIEDRFEDLIVDADRLDSRNTKVKVTSEGVDEAKRKLHELRSIMDALGGTLNPFSGGGLAAPTKPGVMVGGGGAGLVSSTATPKGGEMGVFMDGRPVGRITGEHQRRDAIGAFRG